MAPTAERIPGSVDTRRVEERSTDEAGMKWLGLVAEHDVSE